MIGRRAIRRGNGATSFLVVKAFVAMAARVLGPGPTRLRLVRMAHRLEPRAIDKDAEGRPADVPNATVDATTRAA